MSNAGSGVVGRVILAKLDRSKYELEFDDDFSSLTLDETKWFPYYLPQWKSREATRARYQLDGEFLRLRIEEDQEPWAPEHNGEIRVSNFQTGVYSGPLGSSLGQHRFKEGLVVKQEQREKSLYTSIWKSLGMKLKLIMPWWE